MQVRHYVTKASWYVQDNVVQVVVALALGLDVTAMCNRHV